MDGFVQRQLGRVPAFGIGKVSSVDGDTRALDVNSAGRAHDRTQLKTVLGQPLTEGANALLLAGGDNDAAQVIGYLPFMSD